MFWQWIKGYMPRGLYGRAALILILPVLLLQLLVSVVFIQRHFDGVTQSMTRAVAIELRFVRDQINAAPSLADAKSMLSKLADGLELETQLPGAAVPDSDLIPFVDLTGSTVVATLRAQVPEVTRVSLTDRHIVMLWMDTTHGDLQLSFARGRVSASNPHQLLVIMVVMGAIMTTIAYFFLRNQLRPIKRMAAAAAAYGKGRIEPYSPSGAVEVRAAGTAFLDMRNRIERQTQSRTMMLSGVSHDLRTPLTRLRLGLSLLDDYETEPLIRDVDEMTQLLDGFLDFARSDAADVLVPVVPRTLVEAVVADAQRAGSPVTLGSIEGADVPVPLRGQAIRRALDNLVGNGLRYGTQVLLSLAVTDRAIIFVVEDDGPGIAVNQREEATKPFTRLDPARNQDRGSGVGLGLAIVSDVARSHGGILRLGESDVLGGLKAELVLSR